MHGNACVRENAASSKAIFSQIFFFSLIPSSSYAINLLIAYVEILSLDAHRGIFIP